jgi:ribonucleoside-diphosphate reductase alpha chain/ribonucleoside-diphosphate reductase subunit M1
MYGIIYMNGIFDKNTIKIKIHEYKEYTNFIKNYLKINDIIYEFDDDYIKFEITSKFKFSWSQFWNENYEKSYDSSILHLPNSKIIWIIKAVIDVAGEIQKEFICVNSYSDKLIEMINYLLMKLGILPSNYTIDKSIDIYIPIVEPIANIINKPITKDITYFEYDGILYTNVEYIDKTEISELVYDLEITNNHNYLTDSGLVHNGGKRKGSIAIYLEPHHPDIMAFLDLRKNFGTETERARDLFTAVWLSDLFMNQVDIDGDWYLMCPDDCPGLTDAYGKEYENIYWSYVNEGKYKIKMNARDLMHAILDSQLETGTPYIGYKDHINRKSNHKNIGTIKSSNLCHEIVQYSDDKEYAVCNLASIAINKFVEEKNINKSSIWTIYTKDNCKYCNWAKKYLQYKGYNLIIKNNNPDEIRQKLGVNTFTYPQIFLDNQHIGGWDDLFTFIKGTFNYDKLFNVAYEATKNLNNIIDLNFYPVPEAKRSNIRHRPIGLGIQGLADTLVLLKIPFDSDEALEFNSKMMETIYLAAITASKDLSKERMEDMSILMEEFKKGNYLMPEYYDPNLIFYTHQNKINILYHKIKPSHWELNNEITTWCGAYSSFEGSPISKGLFQFDMWLDPENNIKNSDISIKLNYKEKWDELRNEIKIFGVRNSLVTALMPTASTSQILGNNECFEFFTNNIYTRRTLAGDFPLVNKYLIDDLKSIGLWNDEMKQLILANNGSIANFKDIPEQIRRLYQTIWEIKQLWVLKAALARGPFVDQTQSMNIFYGVPDYQKLYSSHMWSWKNGLKTGIYYLRSRPSQDAAKVTVDPNLQKKLKNIIQTDNYEPCENCSA